MAEITAYYAEGSALTLFVAEGRLSADDLIAAIEAQFGNHPTSIAIWDLWEADLSDLDVPALIQVSDCARKMAKNRHDPKTLFVLRRGQERLLVKLYGEISTMRGSPIRYQFHGSLAEAYEALGIEDPFASQMKSA